VAARAAEQYTYLTDQQETIMGLLDALFPDPYVQRTQEQKQKRKVAKMKPAKGGKVVPPQKGKGK
jgi:hypothetical protein